MICEQCHKFEANFSASDVFCKVCWRGFHAVDTRHRPGQWGHRARLLRAWRKKRADERRKRSADLTRFGWYLVSSGMVRDGKIVVTPRLSGEDIVFSQENAINIVAWERSADENGRVTW